MNGDERKRESKNLQEKLLQIVAASLVFHEKATHVKSLKHIGSRG